jgi:hypothetical protein
MPQTKFKLEISKNTNMVRLNIRLKACAANRRNKETRYIQQMLFSGTGTKGLHFKDLLH